MPGLSDPVKSPSPVTDLSDSDGASRASTSSRPITRSLFSRLFAPTDLMPLACFRIFFGAVMIYHVGTYLVGGWVDVLYVVPKFHFTYPGFSWVRPWPGQGMTIHFAVMGLAAFGIMTGTLYRISAAVFAIGFTYVFLLEKSLYQNHYYLICLLSTIMALIPAHRMWSVDALLRPQLRSQTTAAGWLFLLRAQLAIPYLYGGIAKINHDWLHGMPMRMWLERRTWLPGIGPWLATDGAVYFFAWGGLLFDVLVVPALLWKPTRRLAYVAALAFHLSNAVLWNIGIFPWFMIGATLIFFPAGAVRQLLFRQQLRVPADTRLSPARTPQQRLAISALIVFLAWQTLFPFRHFLYPGNVSWTEEAQLFSWHMMLREKTVGIRFYLEDPETRTRGILNPADHLNPRQITAVGKDVDMILEFTHFVSRQYRDAGRGEIRIYVIAFASLNGRRPQLLMDPTVDCARTPRVLGHQPWIVPLYEPLPEETWNLPVELWESELSSLVTNFDQSSPSASR